MGSALRTLNPDWTFATRTDCDVTNADALTSMFARERPNIVVHAAAITNHQHPNAADLMRVNAHATETVARLCRRDYVRMVYLSTHYVYGGEAPDGGYTERDACAPIGAYAWSKFLGESFARLAPDHLIVRGSWYTWHSRVAGWKERGALTDAWHTREPVESAARKISRLTLSNLGGIINIGGPRRTFYETCRAEFPDVEVLPAWRAELDRSGTLPYPFPRDHSVSTRRYTSLCE